MNTSTRRSRGFTGLLPLAALLLGAAPLAHAQTVITSVPYTISTGGNYVLGNKLVNSSTTTPAITVAAGNVVLDLNGFYISGAANTASNNSVILVNDVSGVTIKNGLLANDAFGINFSASGNGLNYIVENVTISRCSQYGILFNASSPGSTVRNCTISEIGGSTAGTNVSPIAIDTIGGVRIEGNVIDTMTATGTGTSTGINMLGSDFALGNTIRNCTTGIAGGKYLNNLTLSVTTPFSGGTNATGNN